MKKSRFLISGLTFAGLGAAEAAQAQFMQAVLKVDEPGKQPLIQQFRQEHKFTLASHRSHRSHSSHSSHRSGSGGSIYRAPIYTPSYPTSAPTPTPAPSRSRSTTNGASSLLDAPATPPSQAPIPLSGRTELFTTITKRVQLGLQSYGYYQGVIDGVVGKETRTALEKFQGDFNLKVTGTITPEVLDALKIVAQ